jgi:hypothetical protein
MPRMCPQRTVCAGSSPDRNRARALHDGEVTGGGMTTSPDTRMTDEAFGWVGRGADWIGGYVHPCGRCDRACGGAGHPSVTPARPVGKRT